jgi:deoxyribonuclease-4
VKLGVHCSIRNGYVNALYEAKQLGCDCLQFFTHSPRVWEFKFPEEKVIEEFCQQRHNLNLHPLVVHTAYLPNPASSNKKIYLRTRELLKQEFLLAEKFSAEYVVLHPGSYAMDTEFSEAVNLLVDTIDTCFDNLLTLHLDINFMLLLETVCGKGRKIGKNFQQIYEVISRSKFADYIGVCVDTAHVFAGGYNLNKSDELDRMLKDIDACISIKKLKLLHLNDSKALPGSQVDRHEHIGKGHIGLDGFKNILANKYLKELAGILETPKEAPFGQISPRDVENLSLLRSLSGDTQSGE